jgi:hypothetical protein
MSASLNIQHGIPMSLPWTLDNNAKVWLLIAELGKLENFRVLFGKKDKKEVQDDIYFSRMFN